MDLTTLYNEIGLAGMIASFAAIATALAFVAEALTSNIMWVVEKRLMTERVIAMVTSLVLSLLIATYMVVEGGFSAWIFAIAVVVGILSARGSNFVHDFFKKWNDKSPLG